MFLPPKSGEIVGDHEQDAIAYGTHSSGSVKVFPIRLHQNKNLPDERSLCTSYRLHRQIKVGIPATSTTIIPDFNC